MMFRLKIQGFAANMVLLAAAITSINAQAESGVSDAELLVGASVVTSGPLGALGTGISDGAQVYFDQINRAGGVAGRQIKFIALDDAYAVDRTVANVTRLIQDDKVFALLGLTGTPGVMAAMPMAADAKVPLIAPFTGADGLRKDFQRYLFTVTASYGEEIEKIVAHTTLYGTKKIAVAYLDNDFGKGGLSAVEAAMKKRSMAIVGSVPVASDSSNFKAAAATLAKTEPQVVVMVTAGKVSADFIAAYKAISPSTQFYCLSVVSNKQLEQAVGKDSRGIAVSQTMPSPWSPTVDLVHEYQKAMKAGKRSDYSYASLQGYLSAKVFVEGLRRTGRDLTREKFIGALEGMSKVDMGGFMITYSPANHHGSKYVDLSVLGKEGKFVR